MRPGCVCVCVCVAGVGGWEWWGVQTGPQLRTRAFLLPHWGLSAADVDCPAVKTSPSVAGVTCLNSRGAPTNHKLKVGV